jgi:hypothetical protein
VIGILVLASCGGDKEPTDTTASAGPSECDPLVPELCALPWPSSAFEADDPSTATGHRLAISDSTLPVNRDGIPLQGSIFSRLDGFSPMSPVIVYFDDVVVDGAIGHDHLESYADADVKTVIVDTVTHQRVPHWVERDETHPDDARKVLFLRPAVPLEHGRRYVVGIRGLVTSTGAPVAVSDAFRALRDGEARADVDGRRADFEDLVFPELDAQGFARDELQLAWDFDTNSQDSAIGESLFVRDDALARADAGVDYAIDSVEEGDCSVVTSNPIARTIYGHFTTARYTDADAPGSKFVRDDAGLPVYQGDTTVPFMARIPCSLAADPGTGGRVIQYGHGLLGDYSEARGDYLAQLADRNRWVLFAQNWTGMSEADAPYVTLMLATDVSGFEMVPDRTVQGLSEWAVGLRLARGALVDDPSFAIDGAPVIDPTLDPVYYGNSQGAILGGAYVALSEDVSRGVLGVGGMPYSLLLSRSADFLPFFLIFDEKYPDPREVATILGALQTLWDPGESGGYAWNLTRDGLPGTPPKRILMQAAQGDAQVSTLGAEIFARALGAASVAPQIRPIFGVPEQTAPIEASAIAEWLYTDGSAEPFTNVPPSADGDTHECPRREPAAQDQLSEFLETGVVDQFCDGQCVSTRAGLCD